MLEYLFIELVDRAVTFAERRIVAGEIQIAPSSYRRIDSSGYLFLRGDVGFNKQRFAAGVFDQRNGFGAAGFVEVGDQNLGAFACGRYCNGAADATTG